MQDGVYDEFVAALHRSCRGTDGRRRLRRGRRRRPADRRAGDREGRPSRRGRHGPRRRGPAGGRAQRPRAAVLPPHRPGRRHGRDAR